MDRSDAARCLLDHQYLALSDWEDVLNPHAIAEATFLNRTSSETSFSTAESVRMEPYGTAADGTPNFPCPTDGAVRPDSTCTMSWTVPTSCGKSGSLDTSLHDVPTMCARFGDLCAKPAMPLKVPSPHWELPLEDGYVSVVDYRASPYGQGALSSSRRGDDARCGVNGRAAGGATTEGQDASRFQPGDVEMRKQRRREQNRRAAQRCRARKKMREVTITQELQKEVMTMRYLESQLQLLTSEKHDLEMTLTQHGLCQSSQDWQHSRTTGNTPPGVFEVTAL